MPSSRDEPRKLDSGELVHLGDLHAQKEDELPARELVEPYLAALIQAEHLNLLIGAGLTVGLGHLAQHEGGVDMAAGLELSDGEPVGEQLEEAARKSASAMARGQPNLEDRIRVAATTAQGLENVADGRAAPIRKAVSAALAQLRADVAAVEASIETMSRESVEDEDVPDMSLQSLLSTFLGAFAGRAPTRDRAHVFTTNYDRVIEWGAEAAGLRIVDRFVGSLRPVFRSSRLEVDYHYSPPGSVRDPRHLDGVLRLSKLHGSLDWSWDAQMRQVVRSPTPFGRASTDDAGNLLIYPNAAKDVETTLYPYADLFRDFAAATCRPHSVLITYGYSFGDIHINRVIQDMLSIPSTHLLVLSFDDVSGRIARFVADQTRSGQVSLMIGPQLAAVPALVGKWLPWPSADVLLEGRAHVQRRRGNGGEAIPGGVEAGGGEA